MATLTIEFKGNQKLGEIFCYWPTEISGNDELRDKVGDASAVASDAKPFVDLTWEDDNSFIQ